MKKSFSSVKMQVQPTDWEHGEILHEILKYLRFVFFPCHEYPTPVGKIKASPYKRSKSNLPSELHVSSSGFSAHSVPQRKLR